MKGTLGEEGTEQFTVTSYIDDDGGGLRLIREQKVHDPFIHSTIISVLTRWFCIRGLFQKKHRTVKTQVCVRGSHGASARIMTMDPEELQRETDEWLVYAAKSRAECAASGMAIMEAKNTS
jgi:hypothetical protein